MNVVMFDFNFHSDVLNFAGNLGHEAVMVMKNDDVYSLGSNSAGCLGVESLTSSLTPMKVDALCGKGIKGVISRPCKKDVHAMTIFLHFAVLCRI